MDREMSNPRKVPRKKQRPLSNTVMSEREKKLAVLLEKKRQMDLEIEALQGERPETESDPGPSTVEESAEEVEDPANRDWRKIALALAEKERPAPVAVATIQLPSLEKPKFSAGPRDNPVLFLERFESYYAQVREYRPDKLDEVISCLSREAEDFAFAHRHILTDFPSFREEFLRFFWSKAKRTQLRKELLAEQYDPARGTSMVQFFTRQYGRLKMLFPEQEEEEAIDDLMDALPMAVKDAWTAVPTEGINLRRTLEFLTKHSRLRPAKQRGGWEPPAKRSGGWESSAKRSSRFDPRDRQAQMASSSGQAQGSRSSGPPPKVSVPQIGINPFSFPPPNFNSGNGRRAC
jgi:hypothetical protein